MKFNEPMKSFHQNTLPFITHLRAAASNLKNSILVVTSKLIMHDKLPRLHLRYLAGVDCCLRMYLRVHTPQEKTLETAWIDGVR